MINDIDFEGNDHIVKSARPMAERIRDLIGQCRALKVPIIYCNDNFGKVGCCSGSGKTFGVSEDGCEGKSGAGVFVGGEQRL